ncbi:MAG: hypothetical protein ACI8RD_003051 [Bacillariaceae sp.]|jgi:hypothetical protein
MDTVLVLWALLYHSIRTPPLPCTSCDVSQILGYFTRTSTEFPHMNEIEPHLFLPVNCTKGFLMNPLL